MSKDTVSSFQLPFLCAVITTLRFLYSNGYVLPGMRCEPCSIIALFCLPEIEHLKDCPPLGIVYRWIQIVTLCGRDGVIGHAAELLRCVLTSQGSCGYLAICDVTTEL
jgi:hypothetical protein